LFAPPMLASVVVGAAAGALAAKFTDHRLTAGWRRRSVTAYHLVRLRSSECSPKRIVWRSRGHSRVKASSDQRSQFTPSIDLAPTILEAVGLPEPTHVDGIEQEPMDGTGFAYAFDDQGAPERHTLQYFEMFGSRAMYRDGWWAASEPDRIPWDFSPETMRAYGPESSWDPDRDAPW
jgi:hypothetical protein